MNYLLPDLGEPSEQSRNAFLPNGMKFKRGIEYDAGPYKMHIGKNAFRLTPEELYVMGRKLDTELKLGYDGNHQFNANMPIHNGAGSLSYQGNTGDTGTRHELGAELPMFGGRLGLRGSRDNNGNALSLRFNKSFK